MIETVKLEPGWLIRETQKASERFVERLKRDVGVLDTPNVQPLQSGAEPKQATATDNS